MNTQTKPTSASKTKVLAECAILIALSTVLSFVKVWNMPWGGSITLLSMLPVALISVRHGLKQGLFCSFIYACIQLAFGIVLDGLLGWGLTLGMLFACIFLDYILAFTAIGLSGAFAKYGLKGTILGTAMGVIIRFACHILSGVYVFASAGKLWDGFETQNVWLYSTVYNSCYMLPEIVLTLIGTAIVFEALKKRNML
jgi:thiamine transporter